MGGGGRKSGLQRGFTLVELMTAGAVLGVTVLGVATLWRTGRDYEKYGDLRRQAAVALAGALESPNYHHANYANMAGFSANPILDDNTPNPITATLSVTVSEEDSVKWGSGVDEQNLRYKAVTGRISWSLHGKSEYLQLVKRISKVHW